MSKVSKISFTPIEIPANCPFPKPRDFAYPAIALVPTAFLVTLTEILIRVKQELPLHLVPTLRPSELQELYIVWFLLGYAIYLNERAESLEPWRLTEEN